MSDPPVARTSREKAAFFDGSDPTPSRQAPPMAQEAAVELYPAVDISNGRAVRLVRGDFGHRTDFGDPIDAARRLAGEGPSWLHVVDLDAARTGSPVNREVVAAIARAVPIPVQAGGGVRDETAARALLDAGAARVVVGTAALSRPGLVASLVERDPRSVAVGLDYRLTTGGDEGPVRREVAVRGWSSGSGTDLTEALAALGEVGLATVVVTAIDQDGTLSGPDLEGLGLTLESTGMAVIASGGVGSLADLHDLAALRRGERSLAGAVVGRALYDGRFSVRDALAALQRGSSSGGTSGPGRPGGAGASVDGGSSA
jgi:phosphoribosylformimino-5-aminoimidazole carboxamide ribotide isomerase